jgi:adenosylcobinamide-GDP ribazoletransferase
MKRIIDSFLTTFLLVTRIPIKREIRLEYGLTVFFLPLMGVIVVVVLTAVAFVAHYGIGDPFIVAVLILAVQYGLFNIFHFDGLLDSADALIVFAGREKRLEILKDVKIGSFAFFVGVMYIVTKLYLVSRGIAIVFELESGATVRLAGATILFSYAISGRAAAAFVPCVLSPARSGGLGALLIDSRLRHAILGTVVAMAAGAAAWAVVPGAAQSHGWWPTVAFLAVPAAGLLSGIPFKRKIGGYTGDTLGLSVEIGEVLHLLIFYSVMRGAG